MKSCEHRISRVIHKSKLLWKHKIKLELLKVFVKAKLSCIGSNTQTKLLVAGASARRCTPCTSTSKKSVLIQQTTRRGPRKWLPNAKKGKPQRSSKPCGLYTLGREGGASEEGTLAIGHGTTSWDGPTCVLWHSNLLQFTLLLLSCLIDSQFYRRCSLLNVATPLLAFELKMKVVITGLKRRLILRKTVMLVLLWV